MRRTPAPEVRNRTVVILGSSTAEGVGASSQSASWAGRLAQQLAKSGIRVINRSIAGTNTADSLERFDRDVVPYQPGFVILATSIVNEGFESSPAVAYERYIENTTALIGRVREIGAIPMNITMYPVSRYKWEHLALVSQLTEALEQWGWPLFNFWSPVATEDGRWIPQLSADGLHPLDAGHGALYEAIPNPFSRLCWHRWSLQRRSPITSGWHAIEAVAEPAALSLTPVQAAFFLDHRGLSPRSGGWRRIKLAFCMPATNQSGFRGISTGSNSGWENSRSLVRSEPPVGWHHVSLSYQGLSGRLLLSIDGAVWGEVSATPRKQAARFEVAGQCAACRAAQILLYRTNLNTAELGDLAGKHILRRSLEAWAPLTLVKCSPGRISTPLKRPQS